MMFWSIQQSIIVFYSTALGSTSLASIICGPGSSSSTGISLLYVL